jgi:hypothetical protein
MHTCIQHAHTRTYTHTHTHTDIHTYIHTYTQTHHRIAFTIDEMYMHMVESRVVMYKNTQALWPNSKPGLDELAPCMCLCVCMYVSMHASMYVYIYTHQSHETTQVPWCSSKHVCMHVCVVCKYVCM